MFGRGTSRETIVVGKEALARRSVLPPIESTSRQVVAFPTEGSFGEGCVCVCQNWGSPKWCPSLWLTFKPTLKRLPSRIKAHTKLGTPAWFSRVSLVQRPKKGPCTVPAPRHFSFWSSGGCLLTSYSAYPRSLIRDSCVVFSIGTPFEGRLATPWFFPICHGGKS